MKKDNLVSIITPCYNGAKYLHFLFDSILEQTYQCIEVIFVDDGSIDNTKDIVHEYIPLFKKKGYNLKYLFQNNSGQSVAINHALKIIKGNYLTWPDSDDYYSSPNSIKNMVSALDKSDTSVSIVRCSAKLVDESTHSIIGERRELDSKIIHKDLFEDSMLAINKFWFQPICYMAKIQYIDKLIPDREIYTEKHTGQNWQLFLPLLYRNKCLLIHEYLCNIVVRKSSHSRGRFSTYKDICIRNDAYKRTLTSTLKQIPNISELELNYCLSKVDKKYLRLQMSISLRYGKIDDMRNIYRHSHKIDKNNVTYRLRLMYHLSYLPGLLKIVYLKMKIEDIYIKTRNYLQIYIII